MKPKHIIYAIAGMAMSAAMTGCEGEKDLIIIEGNLPIKTSALYMVGDATPNGWSIDAPTPFTANEDDPLIFEWEGSLNSGEMKLCLSTGSWDAPFIRPKNNGDQIGKEAITDAEFQMHAGDPDEKWRINEAGVYHLTFNLREWTMSSSYLREPEAPAITPIATETLYIVGDATPGGWNIDAPTATEKKSDYIFEYEGALTTGDFKACTTTGSWDVSFIRPATDGLKITKDGAESDGFVYVANPDNKWHVETAGIYHLTFNLQNYTIQAEYKGEIPASGDKDPIESATLYMIGDATPGGWSMDDATAYTVSADDKYLFTWEGELVEGTMKACLEPDGTFSCPFLHPAENDCEISANGVAAPEFIYSKDSADPKWKITAAGRYRITFDLRKYTISVTAVNGNEGEDSKTPIETSTLYLIGGATPGGWSMDALTALTVSADNKYLFTWEGELKADELKVCLQRDDTFSCPFIRPATANCKIKETGVESPDFIYTATGDDTKWKVEKAGRYKLTFDLKKWTIEAKYLD